MNIDIERHNEMIREITREYHSKDMVGRNNDTRDESLAIYKDENGIKKLYRKSNGEFLEIDSNYSINGKISLKIDELEEKELEANINNGKFIGDYVVKAKGEIIEHIENNKSKYIVVNRTSKKVEREGNSM